MKTTDELIAEAKAMTPPIRPVMIDGQGYWIVTHPSVTGEEIEVCGRKLSRLGDQPVWGVKDEGAGDE